MIPVMDGEPALTFTGAPLTSQKEIVRKFYKDMWDHADVSLIPEIFHPGFTFRGSLGPVLVGYDQFADYVRWVTDTLEAYTTDILLMVEEGPRVMAKVRFHGLHRKPLFGQEPTGRHVWWNGAPVFTFEDGRVRDLWVLGDIHGLIGRMNASAAGTPEFVASR